MAALLEFGHLYVEFPPVCVCSRQFKVGNTRRRMERMKLSRLSYLLTSVPSLVLLVVVAHADSITPTQGPQTLTGSAVFLSGGSSTTSPPLLTVNDNPFLTNAPLSSTAGAGSRPFETIDLLIAAGALPGVYAHPYFATLESTTFTVDVLSVPEPGTLVLVSFGLLVISLQSRVCARSIDIMVALDRKSSADKNGQ